MGAALLGSVGSPHSARLYAGAPLSAWARQARRQSGSSHFGVHRPVDLPPRALLDAWMDPARNGVSETGLRCDCLPFPVLLQPADRIHELRFDNGHLQPPDL